MQLRDVMTSPPIFVYPETPIWRAARAMEGNDCGFLPVVRNGVALGVVTMRDLTMAVALQGACPYRTKVEDVMTSPALGLRFDADAEDAAILMRQRNVHRLVVTDERGTLRGVVSLGDLAGQLSDASVAKTHQRLTENSGPGLTPRYQAWTPSAAA